MPTKKAALGLSMEMLVVIIISIVILAGGITLLYKFIGFGEQTKRDLDERTDQELERLLSDQGKKVALPLQVADVQRGKTHVFGLGILNIGEVGDQFKIVVQPAPDQNLQASASWLLYDQGQIEIKEGEHRKEGILVTLPKDIPAGTYIFNVQVCSGGAEPTTIPVVPCHSDLPSPYGNLQKFYVNAK